MVVSDLNEVGLGKLLASPTGPVGIAVQVRAAAVVQQARRNVANITARVPFSIEQSVDYQLIPGPAAIIGIRDSGSISRYLAAKAERERESWLVPALAQAFNA